MWPCLLLHLRWVSKGSGELNKRMLLYARFESSVGKPASCRPRLHATRARIHAVQRSSGPQTALCQQDMQLNQVRDTMYPSPYHVSDTWSICSMHVELLICPLLHPIERVSVQRNIVMGAAPPEAPVWCTHINLFSMRVLRCDVVPTPALHGAHPGRC